MGLLDVAAVDRELFRLARSSGKLALRIGEALLRLEARGGHEALGFSSLASWAFERCSRSGRWAADRRELARRLSELPAMRAAFERGELSLSMVDLLSRHATADDEAERLEATRNMTVREVRAALREKGESTEDTTQSRNGCGLLARPLRRDPGYSSVGPFPRGNGVGGGRAWAG